MAMEKPWDNIYRIYRYIHKSISNMSNMKRKTMANILEAKINYFFI